MIVQKKERVKVETDRDSDRARDTMKRRVN